MDNITATFYLKSGGSYTETFLNPIELDAYYENNIHLISSVEVHNKEEEKT